MARIELIYCSFLEKISEQTHSFQNLFLFFFEMNNFEKKYINLIFLSNPFQIQIEVVNTSKYREFRLVS